MRKFIKSLALVAVAAMTLSACQKEVELQKKNADGLYEYSFAILEDGTKAVIGDSNIEWVTGDQVGMFVGSYKGYAKVDVTQTPRMVVLYSNQVIPAGTMAYAYSPFDGSNTDATNAKITLSEIQSGAAISAMPLAGIPFEVKEEVEAGNQEGNGAIKFLNLGSLINFKIYSSNVALQSETITSVKFEATKRLAGTGTLDLTAVNMNDEGTLELDFEGDDEIHFVKVDGQSVAVAASKDDATPIKMVVLPGSFEGTLTITTDAATYTKVMPEREYVRSGLRTWGLDLTKAERVEGVEEVVKTLPYDEPFSTNKGDFSIENIVMPEGLTAVWTHGSHNTDSYMQATAYVGGTRYATESMLVSPWIDLSDAVAAEFTFDNAYSYTSSPATDFSVLVKTDLEGSEWVSISNINYGTGSFNWAKNVSVSLNDYLGNKVKVAFKYTSTSSTAGTWEIKNFSAHIVKADPQISYERETWDVELGDETAVGQELTNPNNLVVTYSSSNTDVVLVDEETGDIVVGDVAGFAIITATFAGDDTYNAGSASYKIVVTDSSVTYAYVKITSTTDLTNGSYLIVNEKASVALSDAIDATGNKIAVSIESNIIAQSDDVDAVAFTIDATDGSICGPNGKYLAHTGSNNSLNPSTTKTGNTISFDSNGNARIFADETYHIQYNKTSGQERFRYFKNDQADGAVQLYKYQAVPDVIPATTYSISIDDTIENGVVTADAEEAEAGTTITLTATPASGYVFSAWNVVDDDDTVIEVTDNQFVMPESNVYVSATFASQSVGDYTSVSHQILDFSEQGYSNQQEISTVNGTNWSVSFDKGSNSNTPKYFTTGTAIRVYGGGYVTITAATGYKINSIKFTFGSGEGSNTITADKGTYSDGTWTGTIENGGSVVFSINGTSGHRRFKAIEIN